MRLDKTGVLMLLAIVFGAKFFWHLFAAGVCLIVGHVCVTTAWLIDIAYAKYIGEADEGIRQPNES